MVPSVQVIVLLPLSRNPSSHDTVSTVPASTGNVASVVSWFQAGSIPIHCSIVSVECDALTKFPKFNLYQSFNIVKRKY